MNGDRLYLRHIRDSIAKIFLFAEEGRESFFKDVKTQDAIIRNFEIIGEAVKRLTPELYSRREDIPWKRIAGFRDVLIHDYMGVKLDFVWRVIETELPRLQQAVEELLEE